MKRRCLMLSLLLVCPHPAMAEEEQQPDQAYGPALFMPTERRVQSVCTYRSKTWNVRQALKPMPAGATPRYVRIHLGGELKARVDFPRDAVEPPWVMLEKDGVVLNGGVESRDLLYAHKPLKVSEVLYADNKSRLRWLGVKRGRLEVGFPDVHQVYRAVNLRKRARVMCADVGLDEGESARFLQAYKVKRYAEPHWVMLKEELPVAAEPGGGPRIFLPASLRDPFFDADSGRKMYFIKLKKGRMKILTYAWNHHILGWVSARALQKFGTEMDPVPAGVLSDQEPTPSGTIKCPTDLRLFAHASGETAKVGVVRKGTKILTVGGAKKGWLKISLPEARWFVAEPGAELLLRASDQRRCPGLNPAK